jgi:mandelamide amidase
MLTGLSTAEVIDHIAQGDISAESYAVSALRECQKQAHLNAFISIEEEQVSEAARACDRRRAAGMALGPLHGLPVAVKDNIYTCDLPVTGGSPAFEDFRPARNASAVQSLLDQGAILLGKTNLHELAFGVTSNNGYYGPVRNPYDPTRVAGGSSGGTASAISAGMTPAGIGTDTGGSTRIPSSFCGIAGFRPSVGRYGGDGLMTMSRTRDTVGPMASDVMGLRLLDAAMAFGFAGIDSIPSLRGVRFGFPRRMVAQLASPEMAAAIERVIQSIGDAGATIVDIDLSEIVTLNANASIPIAIYEVRREWIAFLSETLGIGLREFAGRLGSPDVSHLFQMIAGQPIPDADYGKAIGVDRQAMRHAYGECFAKHGIVAILRPTTAVPAVPIATCETVDIGRESVDIFSALTRFADPSSVAGLPSVTVPAGTIDGLPFGLDLDGPFGGDDDILSLAAAIELVLGRLKPPSAERITPTSPR